MYPAAYTSGLSECVAFALVHGSPGLLDGQQLLRSERALSLQLSGEARLVLGVAFLPRRRQRQGQRLARLLQLPNRAELSSARRL